MSDLQDVQNTPEFRILLLDKIDNLHDCIDRLEKSHAEFKRDAWDSINDHQVRIVQLEGGLAILSKIAWGIGMSTIGIILATVFSWILRKPG